METNYKISIPKPCTENWDKMTPNDTGRFCMSCSKTVVDFTAMMPEEIQHFFIQNQTERICGRFRKSQLDNITIQIPSRVLYAQTQYHKMFLLALFIAMGTTLFSCADKDGNKTKIDKVELVDNPEQNESVSVCYGHQIESKKVNSKKPLERTIMGALIAPDSFEKGSFEYDIIYNSNDLDILPVPEDGMKKLYTFLNKNYITPNDTEEKQKKIFILFVVEKDGTLSNFNIVKNTDQKSGAEAIRVLKTASKWIPGKLNNRIVRSSYILPILIQKIK
ncbi:energy transducer TonB [Flavobacterium reichenbachii]|uniref:TonB C-terminal domain-containing protein n=1 Tax=Flavobacterium reichenbachii TaxID=362418 RepID=A0A085ZR92_9FLAO|nr:hypothetical protein [Flavobacterium reichenbachii]KFF06956.1 hypothetical protein IW19_16175 [Flavobacterium reichenbachii]OXB18454.1 hypothetical protein B0A68_00060 [Flavobacterium reichenbachii]